MRPQPALGGLAAAWGALGLLVVLGYAVARVGGVAVDGLDHPWRWEHIAVAIANTVFMAWSEGYRGFQKSFSPRCAARAKWLRAHPGTLRALLAPLFVMGYFGTTKRRLAGVYGLTAGIVVAIVIIHALPHPWRAALDIGVVVGLVWGMASFVWELARALRQPDYPVSPELPAGTDSAG